MEDFIIIKVKNVKGKIGFITELEKGGINVLEQFSAAAKKFPDKASAEEWAKQELPAFFKEGSGMEITYMNVEELQAEGHIAKEGETVYIIKDIDEKQTLFFDEEAGGVYLQEGDEEGCLAFREEKDAKDFLIKISPLLMAEKIKCKIITVTI
jgi:hypothetical protein